MKYYTLAMHSGIRASILAASFASSVLIARVLGPESLAQYNLVLITFNLVTFTLVGPVGSYIHRMFLGFIGDKAFLSVLTLFVFYLVSISIIIILCLNIFESALEDYYSVEGAYFEFLIFSNIVFSGLFFTLLPTLNILDRFLAFSIISISYAVLSLLVPYLLLMYVSETWEAWLIGVAITQLILLLVILVFFYYQGLYENFSNDIDRKAIAKLDYRSVINFCAPLAIANLLGFSLYNGFRFFLVEDIGRFEYGRFVAGYTIAAGLFGIVEQIISALYHPKIYRGLTPGSMIIGLAEWYKSVETLVVYLIAVSGLLLLVGEELVLLVYGNSLGNIMPYLKMALFLEISRVIASAVMFYFQISKTTSKLYYYYLVAIPLALVFVYILPWPSILAGWVLSIAMGCCGGLVCIVGLIFRQNVYVKMNYIRIIAATAVSSTCVLALDFYVKKMLNIQSPEIVLLVSVSLFLTIFIASDFFSSKVSVFDAKN